MSIFRKATAEVHAGQVQRLGAHTHVLWVGDSVIERLGWFAQLPLPAHVAMLAKGGDRMCHLLWRLEHTPVQEAVTKVILHIASNDVSALDLRRPAAATCATIDEKLLPLFMWVLLQLRVVAPHADVVFVPLYGYREAHKHAEATAHFNAAVRTLPGLTVADDFWTAQSVIPPLEAGDEARGAVFFDHVHLTVAACRPLHAGLLALSA